MNNQKSMTQIEINAEVFRLIKANDDLTPKNLWEAITNYLPDVSTELLIKAIKYIYDKME